MSDHYPNVVSLIQLAKFAGDTMRRNFSLGMKRDRKDDGTPLTETDTAINEMAKQWVLREYPHIQFLGEEGNHELATAEYTILCDPVDGTIPFCRGVPISTFVISVVRDHRPLVAVIHDPFMMRTWCATRGEGAFMLHGSATERLRVSTHDTLKGSYVCMIWWGQAEFNLHGACQLLMRERLTWINPGSLALFGGLLASGEWDATIFPGRHGLETAAMQLIVEEAGGRVTDIRGKPMQYGPKGEIEGHIISNGLIHEELVRIVASCQ